MKLVKIYPNGEEVIVEYADEVAEALLKTNPDRFKKIEKSKNVPEKNSVEENVSAVEPEKEVDDTAEYKPRKKFKFLDKSDES